MAEEYSVSEARLKEWENLIITNDDNPEEPLPEATDIMHRKIKAFYDFLKCDGNPDNDSEDAGFFTAWNEGFDIDNELYADDELELETFFDRCDMISWLYAGPGILAFGVNEEFAAAYPRLADKVNTWRKKYSGAYLRLDESWMQCVRGLVSASKNS